jgi:hypothetical protein
MSALILEGQATSNRTESEPSARSRNRSESGSVAHPNPVGGETPWQQWEHTGNRGDRIGYVLWVVGLLVILAYNVLDLVRAAWLR